MIWHVALAIVHRFLGVLIKRTLMAEIDQLNRFNITCATTLNETECASGGISGA